MTYARGESFRGRAFRHAAPEHEEIGSALLLASKRVGGRINPQGEFGALYLSLARDTVKRELRRKADRAGIPLGDLLPRILLTVDVELNRVLDLTRPAIRTEWGMDESDLASHEHDACQQVARAARRAGYEAIRFPSATGSGVNLAIFLDRLHPGSRIDVVDSEPLVASD